MEFCMIIKIPLSEEKKSGFVQSTDKDTAATQLCPSRRCLTAEKVSASKTAGRETFPVQ